MTCTSLWFNGRYNDYKGAKGKFKCIFPELAAHFFELSQLRLNHQEGTLVCFRYMRDSKASFQIEMPKRKRLESVVQSCEILTSNLNWNQTIQRE